jgi:outer membrane protein assembly factor BamB
MTPVVYQGFIYTLCGENSTFLYMPLSCINISTGELMWTTNNFGMGGIILVDGKLLVLTEDGQLVLAQPNPTAYVELARYQAFDFNPGHRGKCWISPAYSNGRIYAHSTTAAISLDASVAVAAPSRLKLLPPRYVNGTQVLLVLTTQDATPISANRLSKIEVRVARNFKGPVSSWPKLTNALVLGNDGTVILTNTVGRESRRYYVAVEKP